MSNTAEKVRSKHSMPIIGVIGATNPDAAYSSEQGIKVGYELREFFHNRSGSLFTGGVEGVGVDIYTGVLRFCIEQGMKEQRFLDDKFFILIPEYAERPIEMPYIAHAVWAADIKNVMDPYVPPNEYFVLGRLTKNGEIAIVRAGKTMAERRAYVGEIADALVAVNGGLGTLDEARYCLKENKPVFAVDTTGGAAQILAEIRRNGVPYDLRAVLAKRKICFDDIDTSLIQIVEREEDIQEQLGRILCL